MLTSYQEFKKTLLENPEVLLLVCAFIGATVHVIQNYNKPAAAKEGVLGAFVSIVTGVLTTVLIGWMFTWSIREIWFFGFPIAFGSNYFLGGMETLGKQFAESPIKMITNFLSESADLWMEKYAKFKTPKV